jgi:hypothetical protein
MCRDLVQRFGQREAAFLCGVPCITFNRWLQGANLQYFASRRVIWLHWALLLHPELIQSGFDLVTWGRFQKLRARRGVVVSKFEPEDGSGWVI